MEGITEMFLFLHHISVNFELDQKCPFPSLSTLGATECEVTGGIFEKLISL